MRTGGYSIHQSLTPETASLLKHSLVLAKTRGHAQITPLHVAASLLTSKSNLFRRACIKSHPTFTNNYHFAAPHHHHHHPRAALELCFNVALNRLPTIPGPMFHFHPSLSNALVAALKRAQTHQRRGCIEQQQQQQPLLPMKIELELLVVSILDDPGVSRVMREAGFSSTAVKNSIEDSSVLYDSSPGVLSSLSSPSFKNQNPIKDFHQPISNPRNFWQTQSMNHSLEQNPLMVSPKNKVLTSKFCVKEDIDVVVEVLLTKKRNPVIISDSASLTEGILSELMRKVEKGEIFGGFKQISVIKFPVLPVTLKVMKREDVETNMRELKKRLCCLTSSGRSVIIYIGDLKWTVDEISSSCYSPLDHLVNEIGKIIWEFNYDDSNRSKVWVLGNASYETYMKCQMRKPSLETQWALQSVSVPSESLSLSLHSSSANLECISSYENEAKAFKTRHQREELVNSQQKWNMFCMSQHQGKTAQDLIGKSYSYGFSHPRRSNQNNAFSESGPVCFMDLVPEQTQRSINSVAKFRRHKSSTIEFDPDDDESKSEPNEVNVTLDLCHSFFRGDSGKSDELRSEETRQRKNLFRVLQETVPWQSETLPFLVQALMDSLSRKKDAWVLISGNDTTGKQRLARAVAEFVFGSAGFLVQINMMKKASGEKTCSEILTSSLKRNKKHVVLVEDIDFTDEQFMKLIADKFEDSNYVEKGERDSQVVFILTKNDSWSKIEKSQTSLNGKGPKLGQKRTSGWDSLSKNKKLKTDEKEEEEEEEDAFSGMKRHLSWQLGFNGSFDLNSEAKGIDEEAKPEENSPVTSDITGEISSDSPISNEFLDFIKNRFVFDL